jgi:hypothetical protein
MTNLLFSNWSIFRLIRLIFGIFILIQAIEVQNFWILIPGAIFTLMALFNAGCNSNSCAIPTKTKKK